MFVVWLCGSYVDHGISRLISDFYEAHCACPPSPPSAAASPPTPLPCTSCVAPASLADDCCVAKVTFMQACICVWCLDRTDLLAESSAECPGLFLYCEKIHTAYNYKSVKGHSVLTKLLCALIRCGQSAAASAPAAADFSAERNGRNA